LEDLARELRHAFSVAVAVTVRGGTESNAAHGRAHLWSLQLGGNKALSQVGDFLTAHGVTVRITAVAKTSK
jgi:hypothetical protein